MEAGETGPGVLSGVRSAGPVSAGGRSGTRCVRVRRTRLGVPGRWPHRGSAPARREPVPCPGSHEDLVDIAPTPVLARFERRDDRVPGRLCVPTGMRTRGRIAASYVSTREAQAQVHPRRTNPQALFAAVRGMGSDGLYPREMWVNTGGRHRAPPDSSRHGWGWDRRFHPGCRRSTRAALAASPRCRRDVLLRGANCRDSTSCPAGPDRRGRNSGERVPALIRPSPSRTHPGWVPGANASAGAGRGSGSQERESVDPATVATGAMPERLTAHVDDSKLSKLLVTLCLRN